VPQVLCPVLVGRDDLTRDRAGLPSAVHQPIDGLYDERGSFRDAAALRAVFSAVDLDGDAEMITYCTIGGRACTAWFVLSYLRPRSRPRRRRLVGAVGPAGRHSRGAVLTGTAQPPGSNDFGVPT
jgi:hypothetical protein